MKFSHEEYGRTGREAAEKNKAALDAFAKQYRPKILSQEIVDGVRITYIEAAYAEGAKSQQYVKRTSRNKSYEL